MLKTTRWGGPHREDSTVSNAGFGGAGGGGDKNDLRYIEPTHQSKWTTNEQSSAKDKITAEKRRAQRQVKADLYWSGAESLPATATFLFPGTLCK